MFQKAPRDCVFELKKCVGTSGAKGLILLAGGRLRSPVPEHVGRQGNFSARQPLPQVNTTDAFALAHDICSFVFQLLVLIFVVKTVAFHLHLSNVTATSDRLSSVLPERQSLYRKQRPAYRDVNAAAQRQNVLQLRGLCCGRIIITIIHTPPVAEDRLQCNDKEM